jgi:glycosyltransferase involved in cell wall biosynthesis
VAVVPNFAPSPAERPPASAPGHVLVAGRLVEEKGFDTAVRAAITAGVPLVVAGQGPDEGRLRDLAGGAEVRFTGWISRGELAELRANAAAVLAPSRCEEACPYSVLEALATGLPVLVSDRGGLPEMAPAENVLPAEDEGAWTERLRALWRDEQGRRSSGEAALELARGKFGEDRAYAGLMEAYAANGD